MPAADTRNTIKVTLLLFVFILCSLRAPSGTSAFRCFRPAGRLGAELSVLLNQAAALTETIPSMELYSGHKYLSLASGASCRVMSNKCFWREEKKQNKTQTERKREEKPAGTTHQYSRGAPETADRFSPPQTFPALRTGDVSLELLFCCGGFFPPIFQQHLCHFVNALAPLAHNGETRGKRIPFNGSKTVAVAERIKKQLSLLRIECFFPAACMISTSPSTFILITAQTYRWRSLAKHSPWRPSTQSRLIGDR